MSLLKLLLPLFLLCWRGSSMPQVESEPQWEGGATTDPSHLLPHPPTAASSRPPPPHLLRDPLRWIWIEGAALGVEWSSKFSLALNSAVTAYNLTLTKVHETQPFTSVTMYHATALRHQFEDLAANTAYKGRLVALVGQHYWPYSLLGFNFTSPVLKTGHGLGQSQGRVASDISDLEDVNVAVALRWSPAPFVMGGSSGPSGVGGRASHPTGYRLSVWDHKQLVQEITTSVSDTDKGCRVTLKNLVLDTQYKVTLEGLLKKGRVGLTLSFSLDTGGLHVAGGERTTDGVSECYSNLQVRCPGSERCVSPYWICDGSPDCPDGADEVGCDRSPCDGFRCWDESCIPGAWHCDGHEDCRDGEDEYGCPVCSQEAVKCPSGGGCVSVNLTCDGVEDCPDGWDESGEVCKKDQCGPDEVPCWMGQCVEHRQLCDGISDCPTSEDEDSSFCLAFRSMRVVTPPPTSAQPSTTQCTPAEVREINCTQEEFRCASGECVLRTTLCDGKRDCWTADDEEFPICNFIFNVDVAKQEVKGDGSTCDEATMTLCPSGKCVPNGETCDKENDCEENDAERGVTCVNSHEAVTTVSSDKQEKTLTDDIDNEIENDLTIDVPPTTGIISQDSRDHFYKPDDAEDADKATEIAVKNITSLTANNEISAENEIAGENAIDGDVKENDLNLASLEDDDVFDGVEVNVDVLVEGSTLPEGLDADFDVTTTGDFDDDADMEASGDDEFPGDVMVTVSPPSVAPTVLEVTTTQKTTFTEIEKIINELAYNNTDINSILDYSEEDEENHKSTSYSSSMESDESSETEKATFEIGGIGSNMSIENSSFISSKSSLSSLESGESEYDGELLNQTTKSISMLDEGSATTTASAESNITVIGYGISSDKKVLSNSNVSLPSSQETLEDNSARNITTTEASETTTALQETAKTTEGSLSSPNATSEEEDLGSGEAESYGEFDSAKETTSTSPDSSETRHPGSTLDPTSPSNERDESIVNITSSSDADTHTSSSTVEFSTLSPAVEFSTPSSTVQSSPSSSTPEATTTTSPVTTFATEITSWKDQQVDQQNLTVLIAIHSEMNRSRIPQYVIHGLDGNTYEYEVVTVVKDEELARKVQLTATRRPPEGKSSHDSSKESGLMDGDSDSEDHDTETKVSNGTHEISYLQHNDISSASSVSLSLASLATVVLLRTLLPAG